MRHFLNNLHCWLLQGFFLQRSSPRFKICWLATPTSQAWRQATIIDELFESFFESRGKEVGSPHLKEYKTMKAQEYKRRIRVGLGTDASKGCQFMYLARQIPGNAA